MSKRAIVIGGIFARIARRAIYSTTKGVNWQLVALNTHNYWGGYRMRKGGKVNERRGFRPMMFRRYYRGADDVLNLNSNISGAVFGKYRHEGAFRGLGRRRA
jgi:hypothetical protein